MSSVHSIDLGNFVEGRCEFFSLRIGTPHFERDIDDEALGLQMADGKAAKIAVAKIVRDGRKCVTLPEDIIKDFGKLRNEARGILAGFSAYFPFLPVGVFPIPTHRLSECMSAINKTYEKFLSTKDELIQNLDGIKEKQRKLYENAAAEVYDARKPDMTFIDFKQKYMDFFDRAFPSERHIREGFKFRFESIGKIKRSISLMSREEFLKDAETKAKLRVIEDGEKTASKLFYDWIAECAVAVKVGLFKAIYPVVQGISQGNSIGKRELTKIEKHIEEIKNLDLFGDKDFDSLIGDLNGALSMLRGKITDAERAAAEAQVKAAFVEVKGSLGNLEFDPANYRRLELDGDNEQAIIADKEFMAVISEKMAQKLTDAIADLALKEGKTDLEKKEAQERISKLAGIKKKMDDGELSADMADAALRASMIEAD